MEEKMSTGRKVLLGIIVVALLAVFGSSLIPLITANHDDGTQQTESGYTLSHAGKLTIYTSGDNMPFENHGNTDFQGFTIDLMKAVADKMGLEADFEYSNRSDRFQMYLENDTEADVIASSLESGGSFFQSNNVVQTDSYVEFDQCLVTMLSGSYQASLSSGDRGYHALDANDAKESSISGVDDLGGKSVAVVSESKGAQWAESNLKDSDLVYFDDQESACLAIKDNKADCAIVSEPFARYKIDIEYSWMAVTELIPGASESFSMAVKAGDDAMAADINAALQELRSDGTYDSLCAKWYVNSNSSDDDILKQANQAWDDGKLAMARDLYRSLPSSTELGVGDLKVVDRLNVLVKYGNFVRLTGDWRTYAVSGTATPTKEGSGKSNLTAKAANACDTATVTMHINDNGKVTASYVVNYHEPSINSSGDGIDFNEATIKGKGTLKLYTDIITLSKGVTVGYAGGKLVFKAAGKGNKDYAVAVSDSFNQKQTGAEAILGTGGGFSEDSTTSGDASEATDGADSQSEGDNLNG